MDNAKREANKEITGEQGSKVKTPSPAVTSPLQKYPTSLPSSSPTKLSILTPCDALNDAYTRTWGWESRRQRCNELPHCEFLGRSVTGKCWGVKELAAYESELESERIARLEELRLEDESSGLEGRRRSIFGVDVKLRTRKTMGQYDAPDLGVPLREVLEATGIKEKGEGLVGDVVRRSRELEVVHGEGGGGEEEEEEKAAPDIRALRAEVKSEVQKSLKDSLARQTESNLEDQREAMSRFALDVIRGALEDPGLSSKIGKELKKIVNGEGGEGIKEGMAGMVKEGMEGEQAMEGLRGVIKGQLEWWINEDDNKVLRDQLVGLGTWLIPSDNVVGLSRWMLVDLMEPNNGHLKAPLAWAISEHGLPGLKGTAEWAAMENAHWYLRDQWMKDFVIKGVLEYVKGKGGGKDKGGGEGGEEGGGEEGGGGK
ncbi:hypothetical protein TrCOL_g9749 [Triparma columacea]|uniref:Uncharacterized protein n=1 Tax=Triparma columacea TaxID=722753 RepID=A0A9W7L9X9_9STRA|nr:hypothetical protein TrCOL_g9749 [Triparma columacea]